MIAEIMSNSGKMLDVAATVVMKSGYPEPKNGS